MFKRSVMAALSAAAVVAAGAAWAQAAATPAAFSAAQTERGAATYAAACSLCHGVDMSGGPGSPALEGPEFAFGWRGKPAGELFDYLKANMPPGMSGSLAPRTSCRNFGL